MFRLSGRGRSTSPARGRRRAVRRDQFMLPHGTSVLFRLSAYVHPFRIAAALLQLRETLKIIEDLYDDEYSQGDYFAAVSKSALMNYAVDRKEKGSIVLG